MAEEKVWEGKLSCEHTAFEDPWKIQKPEAIKYANLKLKGKKDLKLNIPI